MISSSPSAKPTTVPSMSTTTVRAGLGWRFGEEPGHQEQPARQPDQVHTHGDDIAHSEQPFQRVTPFIDEVEEEGDEQRCAEQQGPVQRSVGGYGALHEAW